jgi:hypothetical protein
MHRIDITLGQTANNLMAVCAISMPVPGYGFQFFEAWPRALLQEFTVYEIIQEGL